MKPMTFADVVSLKLIRGVSISTHERRRTARLQGAAGTDEETSTDRTAYNIISLISRCESTTYRLRSSADDGHASCA